jgi:hypothetical protein
VPELGDELGRSSTDQDTSPPGVDAHGG